MARKSSRSFENYCRARLTTHAFRIGGLQYELHDGFEQDVAAFLKTLPARVDEYEELLTGNRIWVERLTGVGILNGDDCKAYGVTGPVLRGAGVKWDIGKTLAYSGYETYDFDIPTLPNGTRFRRASPVRQVGATSRARFRGVQLVTARSPVYWARLKSGQRYRRDK